MTVELRAKYTEEEKKELKLPNPLHIRNEANKSTLMEAVELCPEETKKRCFDRVNEMLLRKDMESKPSRQSQRYLISQSPLLVRDGSVRLDDLYTPEILQSININ